MLVNETCTALKEVCGVFDLTNMVVDPTCFTKGAHVSIISKVRPCISYQTTTILVSVRTPKVEIIYFELSVSECLSDTCLPFILL
jgi:hypothetical protein